MIGVDRDYTEDPFFHEERTSARNTSNIQLHTEVRRGIIVLV